MSNTKLEIERGAKILARVLGTEQECEVTYVSVDGRMAEVKTSDERKSMISIERDLVKVLEW